MIPSFFFAESKHPANPNLSSEEEMVLNQIFCEMHAEVKEIMEINKKRKASYNIEESLGSNDLFEALPSDFFDEQPLFCDQFCGNISLSSKKKVGRPRKGEEKAMTLPSTGDEDLDAMFFDVFKGNLNHNDNRNLMASMISKLETAGFKVEDQDPKDVMRIFQMYMEETIERITRRPASLNCYDYVRLKDEMRELGNLAGIDIKRYCPTIMRLIAEVEEAEKIHPEYPIRNFPYDKVKSRSPWGYQCLRILDEILYRATKPLSTQEIKSEIRKKCEEYGIRCSEVNANSLKKYFMTLRNMIRVEYNGDFRKAYDRDVFENAWHGHRYDTMINGDKPVTAFKLCFTRSEAKKIQNEINHLFDVLVESKRVSDCNEFADEYPLLAALANIDSFNPDSDQRHPQLMSSNGKQNSSIYILNYLPSVAVKTKKKIDSAFKSQRPKTISIVSGVKEGKYFLLALKEQGLAWAVLARDVHTGLLHLISPSELGNVFSIEDCDPQYYFLEPKECEKGMVGLGDFCYGRERCLISVGLTKSGYDVLSKSTHPLYSLKRRVFKTYEKPHPCVGVMEFDVYINDDLLEELYRLDKKRYLSDIYSEDNKIKEAYLDYLRRMGHEKSYLQNHLW